MSGAESSSGDSASIITSEAEHSAEIDISDLYDSNVSDCDGSKGYV